MAGAGPKLSTLLSRADEVIEWPCQGHVVCCGACVRLWPTRKCRHVSWLDHGLVAATSSYVRRRSLHIAITVFSMSMR
jgi:hypothetical protein